MLDKPFDEWTTYVNHVGIDFPYRAGRYVRASGPGYVRWQGWSNKASGDRNTTGVGAGKAKIVVYDNGVEARYCHLLNLEGRQVGDRVEYGDIIGIVGSTGRSTGPHLHMEIWINGQIQTNTNFWKYVSRTKYVGDGYGNYSRPAAPANTNKGEPLPVEVAKKIGDKEMFIAVIDNKNWYLVVPQGNGKPRAVVLGQDGYGYNSAAAPVPVFRFSWETSKNALRASVDGL